MNKDLIFPLYSKMLLNNAVQYSGANRRKNIGEQMRLVRKFRHADPHGDAEAFREWQYANNPLIEDGIESGVEKMQAMLRNFRDVLDEIIEDKAYAKAYLENLVFAESLKGYGAERSYANKHKMKHATAEMDSAGIDLYTDDGDTVQVKPETYFAGGRPAAKRIVTYNINEDGKYVFSEEIAA